MLFLEKIKKMNLFSLPMPITFMQTYEDTAVVWIWSAAPNIPMLQAGYQLLDLVSLIIQTE